MSDMSDEIDNLFSAWARLDSPGAAVAVMRDGQIVFKRGYGMANLDHDVPIMPCSVFHSASISKQFTAMAVYLLVEEGRLSLEDEVRRHVPELPDFGMPITLDHLLHHTSGLRDQWHLLVLAGWRYSKDLITDEDVLRMVSRQKALNFVPGTRFMYCNTGYTLLARTVANVTGQSFRQFTTSRIFEPLGMTRTFFRDRHGEVVKDAAYGYHPCEDGFELALTNLESVGATSMLTTVEDLARWDENFRSGRVGGKAVFERMHRRGALNDGSTVPYGGGVGLGTYCDLEIVEHTGGDAGYRSNFLRFPRHGLSVAVLSNLSSIDPPALSRRIADVCLRPELEAQHWSRPATIPRISDPEQLERLAGVYIDPADGDQLFHLHFHDGKLLGGAAVREDAHELTEVEESRFRYVFYPRTEFIVNGDKTLTLLVGGHAVNSFSPLEPYAYSAGELEEFVGIYDCAETNYPCEIVLHENGLASTALKQPLQKITPLAKDLFLKGRSRLRFTRGATGEVSGLLLNADRLRNVRFQKV